MKHILFITLNNASAKGGSEKLWRQLAGECASRGYKVTASVYNHQRHFNKEKLNDTVAIRARFPRRFGETILTKSVHHLLGRIFEHSNQR